MKWKEKRLPNHGELRRVKRFLLFPKKILYEWRWLSTEEWCERWFDAIGTAGITKEGWKPMYWIDQETKTKETKNEAN
jgi:hypothetical protein